MVSSQLSAKQYLHHIRLNTLVLVSIVAGSVAGSVSFLLACACLAFYLRRRNTRDPASFLTAILGSDPGSGLFSDYTTSEVHSPDMAAAATADPRRTTTFAESITFPLQAGNVPYNSATASSSRLSGMAPRAPDETHHSESQSALVDSSCSDRQAATEIRIAEQPTSNDMAISTLNQVIDASIGAELRREMASLRAEMARLRSETECAPFTEPPPAYDW